VPFTGVAPLPHQLPRQPLPAWADELGNHRKRLYDAWSDDTMYAGTPERLVDLDSKSRGQCGVSSAWLMGQLGGRPDVADLFYCYGHVMLADPRTELLATHCWVEVGAVDHPGRYVIDLTGDQVGPLQNYEVLCWPHDELLERLGIEYRADRMRLTPAELAEDLVQSRLEVLEARLDELR
jgi:hypothetical protein